MGALIPRGADRSQVLGPTRWPAAAAALAGAALLALGGCDAPARSKPWRHVDDPAPGTSKPASALLQAEADRARDLADRAATLRVRVEADPKKLAPLGRGTEWSRRITVGTVYETLLACSFDGAAARFGPGLAASFTMLQGGLGIGLDLRAGVRFHDGTALHALDVQFSLDTARGARGPEDLRALLADVASVELAGPDGVRIWLRRPSGYALRALCSVPIVPAASGRAAVDGATPPVGSGPYRIEATSEVGVRLVRAATAAGRPAAIERIAFVREPDDARALSRARAGELDVLAAIAPSHRRQQAEAGIARRFVPLAVGTPSFEYLALAFDRPPLDDLRVRQAISLAIDRAAVARARAGAARPIGAPVWPGGPASGGAAPVPAADRAAAGRLLDQAGWSDGDGDGIRERGGQRLQVVALVVDQPDPARALVLAALRDLGIFVDERAGSPAVLLNRLRDREFGVLMMEWRGPPDADLAAVLRAGGRDPEIEVALDALRAAFDPTDRARIATRLGLAIADRLPIVPLLAAEPAGLLHRRVTGARLWDGWLVLAGLGLDPAADPR